MQRKRERSKEKKVQISGVGITNEAEVRHGVEPTYKKVEGFQPLQMTWERFVVETVR